jgi:hypothetical protein
MAPTDSETASMKPVAYSAASYVYEAYVACTKTHKPARSVAICATKCAETAVPLAGARIKLGARSRLAPQLDATSGSKRAD